MIGLMIPSAESELVISTLVPGTVASSTEYCDSSTQNNCFWRESHNWMNNVAKDSSGNVFVVVLGAQMELNLMKFSNDLSTTLP